MFLRRWAWAIGTASAAALGTLAAYLLLTALTLSPGDAAIFGSPELDSRPLYVLAAAGAVAVIFVASIRPLWLILLTVVSVGRAASLLLLGSPDLPRSAEQRGVPGWVCIWFLGLLAVLGLEAVAGLRAARRELDEVDSRW